MSFVHGLLRCIMLQIALCKFLLSRLLQTYTDSTARYHRLVIIIMNWRLSFIEMAFLLRIRARCIFIRIFMTLILLGISRTDRTWLREGLCPWSCYCGHVACSRFQMPGPKTLQLIGLSFVKSIVVVCQRNLNGFSRWGFFQLRHVEAFHDLEIVSKRLLMVGLRLSDSFLTLDNFHLWLFRTLNRLLEELRRKSVIVGIGLF